MITREGNPFKSHNPYPLILILTFKYNIISLNINLIINLINNPFNIKGPLILKDF
jgi:hypothetical protein